MNVLACVSAVVGVTLGIIACWLLTTSEGVTVPALFWPVVFGGGIFVFGTCLFAKPRPKFR